MAQVLDYVTRPTAQQIVDAQYVGAVRYIGFPGRAKCTDAHELAEFTRLGLGMALVFEDTTTTWRGGRAAGAHSARLGRAHADAIGFPAGRPLYLAVDQDVVNTGEFDIMLDYLRGAGDVLGPGLVGVYGEADVIDRARDAGVAAWLWQTVAWSRGRKTTAHLFQHAGYVYVGGRQCDANDVLAADWGQHNVKGDNDMRADEPVINPHTKETVGLFNDVTYETNRATWLLHDLMQQQLAHLAAIEGSLSANQAATLAAIATIQAGGAPTDAQWNALETRFITELGPAMAGEFGRRLSARTEGTPS
jgi:hypothetical protein